MPATDDKTPETSDHEADPEEDTVLPRIRSTLFNSLYHGSYSHTSSPLVTPSPSRPASLASFSDYGLKELRDGFFALRAAEKIQTAVSQSDRKPSTSQYIRLESSRVRDYDEGFLPKTPFLLRPKLHLMIKAFLAILISTIVCLIPRVVDGLGPLTYITIVSALIFHPARSIGAMIESVALGMVGVGIGLLWCLIGLVSADATTNDADSGGILAFFLALGVFAATWIRISLPRLYHACISSTFVICYALTRWDKDSTDYTKYSTLKYVSVPYMFGIAISTLVNVVVLPDNGVNVFGRTMHSVLVQIHSAILSPDLEHTKRLAQLLTHLHSRFREAKYEIVLSPTSMKDFQDAVRKIDRIVQLFTGLESLTDEAKTQTIWHLHQVPLDKMKQAEIRLILALANVLSREFEYGKLRTKKSLESTLDDTVEELSTAVALFDDIDKQTIVPYLDEHKRLLDDHKGVSVFLYVFAVRRICLNTIELAKMIQMAVEKGDRQKTWRFHWPNVQLRRWLSFEGHTVTSQRGGKLGGHFLQADIRTSNFSSNYPSGHNKSLADANEPRKMKRTATDMEDFIFGQSEQEATNTTLRYRLWRLSHAFGTYECSWAIKLSLIISIGAIPAWIPSSKTWWQNAGGPWMLFGMALMLNPTVGGRIHLVLQRLVGVFIGAAFGYAANIAGHHGPYLVAIFQVLFITPALYLYIFGHSARLGIITIIAYVITAFGIQTFDGYQADINVMWERAVFLTISIVSGFIVNLVLGSFVARIELRKSLGQLISNLGLMYAQVLSKRIYVMRREAVDPRDLQSLEYMSWHLRIGLETTRELLDMTKDEPTLEILNEDVFKKVIDQAEIILYNLDRMIVSSEYFSVDMTRYKLDEVLAARRDLVAAIMLTMFTLSAAIKTRRPLPPYMPSAKEARKKLLRILRSISKEAAQAEDDVGEWRRRSIHLYAYSKAVDKIIDALEEIGYLTARLFT